MFFKELWEDLYALIMEGNDKRESESIVNGWVKIESSVNIPHFLIVRDPTIMLSKMQLFACPKTMILDKMYFFVQLFFSTLQLHFYIKVLSLNEIMSTKMQNKKIVNCKFD